MTTWDDKPNDYEHALKEIERLRDVLRDIHDDIETAYPAAWYTDGTTREDYMKLFERINDKTWKALYGDTPTQPPA